MQNVFQSASRLSVDIKTKCGILSRSYITFKLS